MSNRVAEVRISKKMSQEQLAEKAGINRTYLSTIETGRQKTISNVVIEKLSAALEIPICEIFFLNHVV